MYSSGGDGRGNVPKSFLDQLQHALSRPYLSERCRELTRTLRGSGSMTSGGIGGIGAAAIGVAAHNTSSAGGLNVASPKELQTAFNLICSDVFGYAAGGTGVGWNICGTILKSGGSNRDFYAAYGFLCVNGPMLELVERLMAHLASCPPTGSDAYMLYEFPASQLPPGRDVRSSLFLSPFEYYFYHFSNAPVRKHQLTGGGSQPGLATNVGDYLYPLLLEDYLNAYLPLDHGRLVKLFTRSPNSPLAPPVQQPSSSPMAASSTKLKTTLLRQNFSSRTFKNESVDVNKPLGNSMSTSATHCSETWRSEVVVKVIIMFWLESFIHDVDPSHGDYLALRNSVSLPSSELLRVIRMFVKHSHYFANACKSSSDLIIPSSFNPDIFCGDQEAKRIFLAFSSRTIDFWPLDASFRLVLETWLSYIQPWRYTQPHVTSKSDDVQMPVDSNLWRSFVNDNYKFYTVLLAKVLYRFFRVELASSKNAYMLYRVARVYSQENLLKIIKDVSYHQASQGTGSNKSLTMPGAGSFERSFQDNMVSNIFGDEFKTMVGILLCACMEAKNAKLAECRMTESRIRAKEEETKAKDTMSKIVSFIANFINGSVTSSSDNAEIEKALQHLDFVVEKLRGLFDIASIPANERGHVDQIDGSRIDTSFEGGSLSPSQRRDILMRKVRVETRYDGNPDTMPIRSDESGILVRLSLFISRLINDRYHDKVEELYYAKSGLTADMFRHICFPPVVCREGNLDISVSSAGRESSPVEDIPICSPLKHQRKVRLPPRIVLRPLASYKVLCYLAMFYVAALFLFGKSFTLATLYILLFFTLLILFKAIVSPIDPLVEDLTLHSTSLVLDSH